MALFGKKGGKGEKPGKPEKAEKPAKAEKKPLLGKKKAVYRPKAEATEHSAAASAAAEDSALHRKSGKGASKEKGAKKARRPGILNDLAVTAGELVEKVPGLKKIPSFMKRRVENLKARRQKLRELTDRIPTPRELPGWVFRHVRDGLRRPGTRWKVALVGGAALMFVIFMGAVQFPLTTNPVFCGSCHSMRPEMYTWKVSSHRRVTCYSCHVQPGVYWLVRDHLVDGPLGMYREFITGYHDPMNIKGHYGLTRMPNDNCQRCHSPYNRRFSTTKGLKMNHEKHLKQGLRCTICHNRITHPVRGYKNNLNMQACFRCHGAKKDSEFITELEHLSHENPALKDYGRVAQAVKEGKPKPKCSTCHEPEWELKPRSHLMADWAPTKSYEVPTYTGESKREQWEYQSLKISLQPKPAKLVGVYQHARMAKANPDYCYMCHVKEEFCSKCHKVPMPHQKPWWDRHGSKVLASFPKSLADGQSKIPHNVSKILCTKCHRSESFCMDCHKKTVFPHETPWAPVHGKLAKKAEFKQVCTTCHSEQNFCMKCHNGVQMPHDKKKWLGQHYVVAKEKGPKACMRCHVRDQCEKCHSRHGGHKQWTILDPNTFAPPREP